MRELLRPWKLVTLAAGLGILVLGSIYTQFSDWDIGVCFVMGLLTYVTAPWSINTLMGRRYKYYPLAAFYGWLSVDGSYWAWHTYKGNAMLRDGQWQCSLCLWLLCGFIWMWNGSLKELRLSLSQAVINSREPLD